MELDSRKLHGLRMASTAKIVRFRWRWRISSESGQRTYLVKPDGKNPSCTCPDFERRKLPCKHMYAVRARLSQEETLESGRAEEDIDREAKLVEKVTYRQNWPAYNRAQTHEKDEFLELLQELCRGLERAKPQERGRPRIPLSDAIFSTVFKVYSTLSGRRFMSDLRAAHARGHVERLPCYNSISNVMDDPETGGVLDSLIGESAEPLKALESSFACDSSGFSASRFDRWFDHKYGGDRIQRMWVKAHIMCGVRTNVVTALEIQGKDANDAPLLPPLLEATAARFDVREVSADLGYSSLSNLEAITQAGASSYIPFKHNTTDAKGGLWSQMFHLYSLHREQFMGRYHLRSNVETAFHMIKAKFGDSVRSKTDRAMANEVRAKILCHNICCLIQSMHEFGVEPNFSAASGVG